MTPDERAHYASQSSVSDPGDRGSLLDAMPADPATLVETISGILLHPLIVKRLGITPHPESAGDVEARSMATILARIAARDPAPLDVARPPERRFVGICRDYTLLACAALRHRGVAARARVGFATYFVPGVHDDHWVCEYERDGRWQLLDPQLGETLRRHYGITFSPADVPRDAFLVAAEAWRRIRHGVIDPATVGVHAHGLRGAWFAAASVLRDLAALNKREMLGWDYWGLALRFSGPGASVPDDAAERLDAVSAITAHPEPDWRAVREIYEKEDGFRVPSTVRSFGPAGPREVMV